MAILVDTSVLVRLRNTKDPRYPACRQLVRPDLAAQFGLCLCAQSMIEYWVVATRPVTQNGLGLSVDVAMSDLEALARFLPCLPEPPDVADRWLALVQAHRVMGKPAHDARFVAVLDGHALTRLLTLNLGDFTRYRHVECLTPEQLLSAAMP